MYISHVETNHSMKLQSNVGTVDFYPVQLPDGWVCADSFLKVLKFNGTNTVSEKYVTKKEMQTEVNQRVAVGDEVVDFNTTPQYGNPMACAC